MARERKVTGDRGASNLVGIILLISLSIVGSVAILATGVVMLDAIGENVDDGLGKDKIKAVDAQLSALSETSGFTSQTFTISGDDFTGNASAGEVNITIEAVPNKSYVESRSGVCNRNITMGTIRHSSSDGVIRASQGGGLWRKSGNKTFVEEQPQFSYNGTLNSLDLSFVNITSLPALYDGQEITAKKNASTAAGSELRKDLRPCWNVHNSDRNANVNVTVTIESEYAEGWRKYAENSLNTPPDELTQSGDTVTIEFWNVGEEIDIPASNSSTFNTGATGVIYSGLAKQAVFNENLIAYKGGFVINNETTAFDSQNTSEVGVSVFNRSTLNWVNSTGDLDLDGLDKKLPNTSVKRKSLGPDSDYANVGSGDYKYVFPDNAIICVGDKYLETDPAGLCKPLVGINTTNYGGKLPEPRGNFQIVDVSEANPDPAVEGDDTIEMEVEVNNTGTGKDTQEVTLRNFDDEIVNVSSVQLAPNESTNVTLSWETKEGDEGEGKLTASTENDQQNNPLGKVTVRDSEDIFKVDIDETNEPITEGEILDVNVTVENVGTSPDEQHIALLDQDGNVVDQWDPNIPHGNERSETLYWNTTSGDNGTHSVIVESEDDSESKTVNILRAGTPGASGNFELSIDSVDTPVSTGEDLSVETTVTNSGTSEDTQFVVLRDFDGDIVDATKKTIAENSSQSVTLTWSTDARDDGSGDLTIETEDDTKARSATVKDAAVASDFQVSSLDANNTIQTGDVVKAEATIANKGSGGGSQQIILRDTSNSVVNATSLTLKDGDSESVTLTWQTDAGDSSGDVTFASEDDSETQSVTINNSSSAADFEVTRISADSPVDEGEEMDVEADIKNAGSGPGTREVVLRDFDDNVVNTTRLSLSSGGTETITLTWETETGDEGSGTISLATGDDENSTTATVERPPTTTDFEVDSLSTNSSVEEGEILKVEASVENDGSSADEQVIVLEDFDGDIVDSETVSLGSGDSEGVTLLWQTEAGDADTDDVTVVSQDDSETATATVNSGLYEGVKYVGPPDIETARSFFKTNYTEVSTAYNATGPTGQDPCISYLDEREFNSGTSLLCDEDGRAPVGGYVLNDVLDEEYEIYAAIDGSWKHLSSVTVDNDAYHTMVHGADIGLDTQSAYDMYLIENDTAVCLADDGAGIDPAENCGKVPEEEVTGGFDYYNDSSESYLEVNSSAGEFSLLTTQIGNATTLKQKTVNTTRKPVNVFFVLDESGSMFSVSSGRVTGSFDGTVPDDSIYIDASTGKKYAPGDSFDFDNEEVISHTGSSEFKKEGKKTVPKNEIWGYDGEIYYPGESVSIDGDEAKELICGGFLFPPCTYGDNVAVFKAGNDPLDQRIEATKSFIGTLETDKGDKVGATQFYGETNLLEGLTDKKSNLNSSLYTAPGGTTNISAGIYEGIDELTSASGSNERIIVLLSDGKHKTDEPYPSTAAEDAADANITIYTVGLGDGVDEDTLEDGIALETGGSYKEADNADELESKFDVIANESTTSTKKVIKRDTTKIAVVTNSTKEAKIKLDGADNVNDPTQFNDSSTTVEKYLSSGLKNEKLSFRLTLYSCGEADLAGTNATSTKSGTVYTHTRCSSDSGTRTRVTRGDIQNHTIITNDNGNDLSDVKANEWWQPDPSSVTTIDKSDLADNEALFGLEIDTGSQSGYALVKFRAERAVESPDYPGNVTEGDDGTSTFEVSKVKTNSSVIEGESLGVNATIENTGEVTASKPVTLRNLDDEVVDSETVTLAPGDDPVWVNMTWDTEVRDSDTGNIEVVTEDSQQSEAVTINEVSSASFDVSDISTNSPVTEGERLEVTVDVENTGSRVDTQYITLKDFDGNVVDSSLVEDLAPGGKVKALLTWKTQAGDQGNDEIKVQSDTDSTTQNVEINEATGAANFDVSGISTNSPVTEGSRLEVDVDVENTGSKVDTQYITLKDFDGNVVDSSLVEDLAPTASKSVSLNWTTESGDQGNDEIKVQSDTNSTTQNVEINEATGAANFDVSGISTNSPVTEGDTLTVNAEVENTGSNTDSKYIRLRDFDGNVVNSTFVSGLSPGDSKSVSLRWNTQLGDSGDSQIKVNSDTDSASKSVEVRSVAAEPDGIFDVSIKSTSSPVNEGTSLSVDVWVNNTASSSQTQFITLRDFDGNVVDSEKVTRSADTNSTIDLKWYTEKGDSDIDDISVASEDRSDSREVEVTTTGSGGGVPQFEVQSISSNEPIYAGDELNVSAQIKNNGSGEGTQYVYLEDFDNNVIGTNKTTISAGVTETVNLTWQTGGGDNGTDDITVVTEDDIGTQEITIRELTIESTEGVTNGTSSDPIETDVTQIEVSG